MIPEKQKEFFKVSNSHQTYPNCPLMGPEVSLVNLRLKLQLSWDNAKYVNHSCVILYTMGFAM